MKKKIFVAGLALATGLTLASCGGGSNTPASKTVETGTTPTVTTVDVFLNYKNTSGITFQTVNKKTSHTNPIDGKTYSQGSLLPAWAEYEKKLNLKLRDASTYNEGDSDDKTYKHFNTPGWKSSTDANQMIDLFMNSTANINTMGSEGKAVNLKDFIDAGKMPNFKKYLEAHPEIRKEIEYGDSKAIYFTPYLDGYNAIERMLVIDSHAVEVLLDTELAAGLGELPSGATNTGESAAKTIVGAPQFTPFIDADHNYPNTTTTVKVDKGGAQGVDLVIKQTENIIKQQNTSLRNGTTGKALIAQFKAYLDAAFEGQIGEGKTYPKYSDIFTSQAAAYNTDELVALMRVFKANPDVLLYDVCKDVTKATTQYVEVEPWFPRGLDNSRIQNLLHFGGELFGVQGMGAEKDNLFFTADGKLHDAATVGASYEMLNKLNEMYKEGLLLTDFWAGSKDAKVFVNKYFAHTNDKSSFGLVMHDYTATQSAPNDLKDGLGTNPTTRKTTETGVSFSGYSVQGIHPILSPLTYWPTSTDWTVTTSLGSHTGKTLTRFYEENRAVKSGSWCIPSTADNKDGAVKLMDYLFSEEGNRIHNFGPDSYWTLGTVLDEQWPVLKAEILSDYSATGGDIWDYFRGVLGTTQGVGHYRPTALDYQSTNFYAKDGYNALNHAVLAGVQITSKCVSSNYTWSSTVPVSCYPTIDKDTSDKYAPLTKFWAQDKLGTSANGWVVLVKESGTATTGTVVDDGTTFTTYSELVALFTTKNTNYLYKMANSIGATAIPDEAKQA